MTTETQSKNSSQNDKKQKSDQIKKMALQIVKDAGLTFVQGMLFSLGSIAMGRINDRLIQRKLETQAGNVIQLSGRKTGSM